MAKNLFAERLAQAMDAKGFKQVDLIQVVAQRGNRLGKSQLSQYLSGKTIPRSDVMAVLADALDVSAEWLVGAEPVIKNVVEKEAPKMRTFKKSSKLDHVSYDVRGPALDEAMRMEEEGIHILKLNIGNPAPFGFRTPDEVVQDMASQLRKTEGYSDSRGLFSARKAIMQYDQLKGIPNVTMNDIYTGNGVSDLINLVMQAMVETGDEILVPSPDYPLWTACVTLAGGNAVHYLCDEQADWMPDVDDIRAKITANTKAIVIINPNNPTGALYPREVLEEIVEVAREHQLIVLSDEIYDRLEPHDRGLAHRLDIHLGKQAHWPRAHRGHKYDVQHAPLLQRSRAVRRADRARRTSERKGLRGAGRPRAEPARLRV